MEQGKYDGWEKIEPLGQGGQSDVFLVRSPMRARDRERSLTEMRQTTSSNSWDIFAEASLTYARPDLDSELGALKVFKIRSPYLGSAPLNTVQVQEVQRLKNEIKVLREGHPGLPKLLAHSETDFWIVTEYFRESSLEKQLWKYKNKPLLALLAFRSLVATVKSLHDQGMVHRDIKPANIFVRAHDDLVLGDFGIVFLPSVADRVTETGERVGPRDYMAPWLDTGERVEEVEPCSDVYMLGKLLWCMVSGRLKLPREYHRAPSFDLNAMFPTSPDLDRINLILDKCLVSECAYCLQSAGELLTLVDETINNMGKSANRFLPNGELSLVCLMCGKGTYRLHTQANGGHVQLAQWNAGGTQINNILMRMFVCNVCTHYAMFAMGYPEEGAKRGWKPS